MSEPYLPLGQGAVYDDYTAELMGIEAANIVFGDNPTWEMANFLAIYPQFGQNTDGNWPIENSTVYQAAMQMYINLASACLSWLRWRDTWELGMANFVAHFLTLWLQAYVDPSLATSASVASAGLAKGIMSSKSVGDVSASYQLITQGWEGWGSWNLTTYGQQLVTFAKMMGAGMVYVW